MTNFYLNNDDYILKFVSEKDAIEYFELSKINEDARDLIITFFHDLIDGYNIFSPNAIRDTSLKQWNCNIQESSIYKGAPTLSILRNDGNNNICVSLSDCITPVKITLGVDDFAQKDEFRFLIYIPSSINEKVIIRLDKRNIPFTQVMYDLTIWWKNLLNIDNTIPHSAKEPLYSSWYNFHQHPNQKDLQEELKIAKQIGFKTFILDDGWQFDGDGVGDYSECGDWIISKEKFPNFKDFVDYVHSLDMKILVWFPIPFLGKKTKNYEVYKDYILYFEKSFNACIVDIRYKKIRQYIVSTYKSFIDQYGIDGLKLDFIDSFMIKDDTPPYNEKMDSRNLQDAVCKLLEEIKTVTTSAKNDFLIEFRQFYVSPAITKYCSMIRVLDTAYDAMTNRIAIINLKLLTPYSQVHSDMLLWANLEAPHLVAKQLLNIMFAVPQISVLLKESSKEHLSIIKNYLSYYQINKDILLDGHLSFSHMEVGYSLISSAKNNKKINVLYSQNNIEIDEEKEDVFNATNDEKIYLNLKHDYHVKLKSFYGEIISSSTYKKGVHIIQTPLSYSLELEKLS